MWLVDFPFNNIERQWLVDRERISNSKGPIDKCAPLFLCMKIGHRWEWCGEVVDGNIYGDYYMCARPRCSLAKTVYRDTGYGVVPDIVMHGKQEHPHV